MIISHRHRFIFFAVPKVATRALRQALTMHTDSMDWQQQNLFAERRLPIGELANKEHGHLSVREVRPHLPEEIWASYFKFAFVRNPYERFVDTCRFLDDRAASPAPEATAHMKRAIRTNRFRRTGVALPQSEFLVGEDGEIALDYIGRYEHLQPSYDEACRLIGIESTVLERRRRPDRTAWRACYDDELLELVTEFYRVDLGNFGYRYDESQPVAS